VLAPAELSPFAPARGAARAVAARVAHAGVLVAAVFLPISTDVPEYALLVALLALGAERTTGLSVHRRSGLDLPVALAVGASLAALGIALATGLPAPHLELATRFRSYLAPVIVLSALSLPLPGDGPDAPRARAVRVLLAWCLAVLAASAVGIVQGAAGIDPLHALGLRRIERLPPVPGWPGHFAATGFFSGYARFGQSLFAPLLLAAALALSGGLSSRRRLLLGATAAAATVAVIFTSLRTGWASVAVGGVVLLALSRGRLRAAGLPLAAGAGSLALLHPGLRGRLAALLAGEGNGDRETIWRVCAAVWRDHPLGVGPGNFEALAPRYWAALAPGTQVMPGCHSAPLQLLVDGGPLLAAAGVAAVALAARPFWRAARDARDPLARAAATGALAAIAAFSVSALVHDVHRAPQVAGSAGLALGLAAILALPSRPAAPGPP
jgi:hypothetical protein